jgi:hypothetical protein
MYSLTYGVGKPDDNFETIAALAAMILSQKFRGDFVVRQHLNWELNVKTLLQEGQFKKNVPYVTFIFQKAAEYASTLVKGQ